ncbi:hypothetical protein CVIRNUC_011242 [Coccomyxa viridis]|uniref:Uncharacterized protein n=1 Tax=Coccomyxa viridis TaxID=1274662 RepID=A0AAV1INF1_9CHLO|nr:hypothetical protein CVIRNUC_011242 [Coccomyxa viridis]
MPYHKERHHREMLFEMGLKYPGKEAQIGDLIMSGDLDEVPKAEPVRAVKHCVWEPKEGMDECVALEGSYFYFSYSWYAGEWSAGPRVVKWLGNGTSDGRTNKYDMRYHANCSHVVKESSWHCTDCFATIAQTKRKISSFLHHEMDRFPYNESSFIVDRAARGLALFTNNEAQAKMRRVSYCDKAPPFVLANPERFHYLLSRDPVTASYSDYAEYLGNRTDIVGNFHGEWYNLGGEIEKV